MSKKKVIVFCQGCHNLVDRDDAEFVIWGDVYCHFCKGCLDIISENGKAGKDTRPEELRMAKI